MRASFSGFAVATACGVLFAKFMNLFTDNKINPLVGAAGVSAVPDSARVGLTPATAGGSHQTALEPEPDGVDDPLQLYDHTE